MVETPAPPAAEPEHLPEQPHRGMPSEEGVLPGGALVAESGGDGDALDVEVAAFVEEFRDLPGRLALEERRVDGDAEPARPRKPYRLDRFRMDPGAAHRRVVAPLGAVEVDGEREPGRGLVIPDALPEQQRVRAQVDEAPALDEAAHDLRHLLVDQGLAAGDGHDGRTAFLGRADGVLDADAPVEDRVRVVDLPASRAREVAAEQRLQHQHQGIALLAAQPLAEDVGSNAQRLSQRDTHVLPPSPMPRPGARAPGRCEDSNAVLAPRRGLFR